MEGCFTFQWVEGGGRCFSDEWDIIFKWGGTPWGASVLMGGGRFQKKLKDVGALPPHYSKP